MSSITSQSTTVIDSGHISNYFISYSGHGFLSRSCFVGDGIQLIFLPAAAASRISSKSGQSNSLFFFGFTFFGSFSFFGLSFLAFVIVSTSRLLLILPLLLRFFRLRLAVASRIDNLSAYRNWPLLLISRLRLDGDRLLYPLGRTVFWVQILAFFFRWSLFWRRINTLTLPTL
jgi:hypothetical protein